ncbi:MAG TPA: 2-oxoacid:acceptor oxidoreductase family protein [Candidatus Bathyarchaeia archaeon]|nr:2-oxoacid:acceptor oxidoreductase family protein [Candidatus Bathyarchaeia archaeon]
MFEEIRWHGRGGQGAVTSAKILAEAAHREGKFVQAFAFYGAERRGAPVETYTRISDSQIKRHSAIYHPTVVSVLDPVLPKILYLKGITDSTTLVVNSNAQKEFPELNCKKFWIDATQIAIDLELRVAESYITNTIMTGAVAKATGLVKIDSMYEAIKNLLNKRIWDQNLEAAKRGYNETKPYTKGG